jgi:integrase
MARTKGEGTLYYRRKADRWEAQITLPDGKRRIFYAKDKEEARKKLHDAQEAVRKNLPIPAARVTLGEYLDRWLQDVAPQRVRPSTLKRYEQDIRVHLKPALGKVKLAELTPQWVQKLIADLSAKGLKPNTVRNVRAALRVALAQAEREGAVSRNVAKLVTLPRAVQKRVRPLSPADARRLLDAFKDDEHEPLIVLALATGLRQGELLGLRWDDVDFEAGTLRVERQLQRNKATRQYELLPLKTERSRRTLALGGIAVEALRTQRARQAELRLLLGPDWPDLGLVFTSLTGNYLSATTVTHHFQQRLQVAGLPRLAFHDLRHGAASLLLAQGADLKRIQEQLGHSTIRLTGDVYAHLVPELLKDNAALLDRALGGAASGG